jgi:hypothetical protein
MHISRDLLVHIKQTWSMKPEPGVTTTSPEKKQKSKALRPQGTKKEKRARQLGGLRPQPRRCCLVKVTSSLRPHTVLGMRPQPETYEATTRDEATPVHT